MEANANVENSQGSAAPRHGAGGAAGFEGAVERLDALDQSSADVSVFLADYDAFTDALADLCEEHEREVAAYRRQVEEASKNASEEYERGLREAPTVHWTQANICDMTDEQLAADGLVRLPVDADGVTWRGDEKWFHAPKGTVYGFHFLCYRPDIGWQIGDQGFVAGDHINSDIYNPSECRHVKSTDTPASLAEDIQDFAFYNELTDAQKARLHGIADRLRALGGGEDA